MSAGEFPSENAAFIGTYFTSAATTLVYAPFAGSAAENSGITAGTVAFVMPFDGFVDGVLVYFNGDPGSTVVGLHSEENTTAHVTATVDPGAAEQTRRFAVSQYFTEGTRVHVSVDVTDSPVLCRMSTVLRPS